MIGQRLLHYEITDKLGEGGMGVVYKARDTHLDRFVAIKVLPPERTADPTRKARFVQEAKAASALNHPNIVTIHDISQDGGVDFIAMEYVEGRTLDQMIPRNGMRLNEALKIAIQIADALARAHAAGIIHRDLKPANIMVDGHGHVKVLDFGLAKLTEVSTDDRTVTMKTEEGAIVGTAAYMSPEQAEGRPLDARSDIFSFGAVLYEMVSGRQAFQGDSRLSTLAAVLNQDPKPPEHVPHDLEKVISRCFRKDPDRRFQFMKDVKVELEELKEESDSGKLAPAVSAAGRWRWHLAAGGLAALAALAGFAGWWWLSSRESGPAAEPIATPLTAYPGIEAWPSFSPDGNQVAFAWNGEKQDNFDIYVKVIGPDRPLRLTTDAAVDLSPAWSPDGRWIAFLRVLPGRGMTGLCRLVLIPALGGAERVLAEPVDVSGQLSWSPDSKWVFAGQQSRIVRISIETGESMEVSPRPRGASDLHPALASDGRRLVFMRWKGGKRCSLLFQRLTADYRAEGEASEFSPPGLFAYYPAWTPDGRDILFAGSNSVLNAVEYAGQPTGLWRVPAAGGEARRLAFAGDNIWTLAVSKNNRLALSRWQSDCDIHRAELDADGTIRKPSAAWLPSSLSDENAQYSPDGKLVAFSSARGGSQEVWVANADGTNARPLTSFGGHFTGSPRWSPAGDVIVFNSRWEGKGEADIFTISIQGTGLRRLTDDPSGDVRPSYSRDGRWIYFCSGRGGRSNVWKVLAAGGPATRVTENGGMLAQESADGKWLYYTKAMHRGGLWRRPLAGGDEERVVERVPNWSAFSATERGVYYITFNADFTGGQIHLLGYGGGKPRMIGVIDRPPFQGLSLSPDGKQIMYSQRDRFDADLMLVENFR